MVNEVVLKYFRDNKGKYSLADLKKKVLASGYSEKEVAEAVAELGKKSVSVVKRPMVVAKKDGGKVEKKVEKKKFGWWKLILILIFVLGLVALGVYYYLKGGLPFL